MLENASNRANPTPKPPKLGQKLLYCLLVQEDCEAILGDLAEEYALVANQAGLRKARWWYWLEVLRSIPALFLLFNQKKLFRSLMMKNFSFLQQTNRQAIVSLILLIPAFLLVFGGILQSFWGITQVNEALNFNLFIFHPLILMGGIVLAFGLNLIPIVHIEYQDGNLVSIIKVKGNLLNLGLISAVAFLLAAIFLYALAENFQLFAPLFFA